MSSLTTFPFFRLTLIWISGIIAAFGYPVELTVTLMLSFALLLIYLSIFIHLKFRMRKTLYAWFNSLTLLLIFVISYGNTLLHIAQKEQSSLSKWSNQHWEGYQASIEKVYPTPYNTSIGQASVTHVKTNAHWYRNRELIQLYFSKTADYSATKGDILLIRGRPVRTLLDNSQVDQIVRFSRPMYHQVLRKKDCDFILCQAAEQNKSWPEIVRWWYRSILQKEVKETSAIALIETLLFGAKDQLDPALSKAYAATGTMHILAVSGLHVGMIYWLISIFLGYLLSNRKFLETIFTIMVLWLYAWLCSFAPSILRATIMITLAQISLRMGRSSNSYNGLYISAFILLVWQPLLLFNPGCQLSYMATLGILYLQPRMQSRITVKSYWLQKLGQSTTLSIAAQMSTLPLILHYFKQFPIYFIIANWVIVPAMFIVLMLSLALAVAGYLPLVNSLLGLILAKLIWLIHAFVCWITQWPISNLYGFSVNSYSACLLYGMLIATCLFFRYKKPIYPIIVTICMAFYAVIQINSIITARNIYQMICYNNHALSFTLQDSNASVNCYGLPLNHNIPYLQSYGEGIMAAWHGKIILTIDRVPSNWHYWNGAKLEGHYLLITQKLVEKHATLIKVCNFPTWVVYGSQTERLPYGLKAKIKKLDIKLIWLQPDKKKVLIWNKKA